MEYHYIVYFYFLVENIGISLILLAKYCRRCKMSDEFEYLKVEKDKAWARIVALEEEINILKKSIPENVQDIQNASRSASKYRNRCEESAKKSQEFEDSITNIHINMEAKLSSANDINNNLQTYQQNGKKYLESLSLQADEINLKYEKINEIISEIEEIYKDNEDLSSKIEELNSFIIEGTKEKDDIALLYKQASLKRNEIYNLHREIIGYDEKNEDTGEEEHFSGLKEELEDSYNQISTKLETISENIDAIHEETKTVYSVALDSFKSNSEKKLQEWENNYQNLKKKIENLLPDALTTGLSHAYSRKRYSELQETKGYQKVFKRSIIGLTAISLIPIIISIYSIFAETPIDTIIERLPKIVFAFLPLYAPLLWVACSSDKKIKLAKRLIEEYTHKEVLSKTYQALVKQINALEDSEASSELKTKLLYNLVLANSENPGKLITDYNTTDNPLMDALDKSTKLANAIEKLSKIPGFAKIAENLARKSERQQETIKAKVDAIIEDNLFEENEGNK